MADLTTRIVHGRVIKIVTTKDGMARATLSNEEEEQVIIYNKHLLPLELDDRISFVPAKIEHTRDEQPRYHVGEEWEVDLQENESAIRRSIQRALNKTEEEAQFIYEQCALSANKKGITVMTWLDEVSERTRKRKKKDDLMKLQSWWVHHRIKRRLVFLKINEELLEECREFLHTTNYELYKTILADPLKVLPLPIEFVHKLVERFELEYTTEEFQLGEIARIVYFRIHHEGDVCVPRDRIKYPPELIERSIELYSLRERDGMVFDEESYNATEVLVNDLAERIERLRDGVQRYEPKFSTERLTERQRHAVKVALNSELSIITGGGGTGKTTIIKEIIYNCNRNNTPYLVVAFTGTAVNRVKEVTVTDRVLTIHMALGRRAPLGAEGVEEDDVEYISEFIQANDLHYDDLIVDEMSMVPSELFSALLQKRRPKRVTLIGDKNQLQPIGYGSLCRELLSLAESSLIPLVKLDKNHRSKKQIYGMVDGVFRESENFHLIQTNSSAQVTTLYEQLLNEGHDPNSIMVLTSHRELVAELNIKCQNLVKHGASAREGRTGREFYLNDKVIMLKNNYLVGQMNGDMGRVTELGEETITVKFKGGKLIDFYLPTERELVSGQFTRLRQLNTTLLDLAFCTTVHKSQGKEAPIVVLYIKPGLKRDVKAQRMFNQCWLYTALSRAQERIYCIGDLAAMNWMSSVGPPVRFDCLAEWTRKRLEGCI